jgi:hypothetical protein
MPPSVFPAGVTIYDPDRAENCYVIFDGADGATHIIDMAGNEVKTWPHKGVPSEIIDPDLIGGKKGHVFVGIRSDDPMATDTLQELDWNDDVVWEWGEQAPGGKAQQHHDQARLPNGNTLINAYKTHVVPTISDEPVRDNPLYEVTPEGKIVWTWLVSEHLEELGFPDEKLAQLRANPTGFPLKMLLVQNNMSPLGPNKWFDAGDDRFHPDNILIDARFGNFIAIIDKASGSICWRMGPDYPAAYDLSKRQFSGPTPRPIDMTAGQHDVHMIEAGLPGAGNILIFDNQGASGYPAFHLHHMSGSRVLEVDPTTQEIVWQYDATKSGHPPWTFHSKHISSARRLPNGNTLINEGEQGRLFQVTPDGEIVWEFVSPYRDVSPPHPSRPERVGSRMIYRAQPVPYDWLPDGTARSEEPIIVPDYRSAYG